VLNLEDVAFLLERQRNKLAELKEVDSSRELVHEQHCKTNSTPSEIALISVDLAAPHVVNHCRKPIHTTIPSILCNTLKQRVVPA
jgi:hypothetical protein